MFKIKILFDNKNKLFESNFLFKSKLKDILKEQLLNENNIFIKKYKFFLIKALYFLNKNIINEMLFYHINKKNKITQLIFKKESLGFFILNDDSNFEIDKIDNYFIYENHNCFYTINSYYDLINLQKKIFENNCILHINNGVNIIDSKTTYIDNNVTIKINTTILPGSIIIRDTSIGKNNVIGPNSLIQNCNIGDNCNINNSCLYNSNIKNNVNIGPYTHIRPNCIINNDAKVGSFVELKKSTIDSNTKISHLTYIGNAIVGKNVNFGCGCVTVNFDGKNKHETNIQDNAFIGCNVNLIAPIKIGSNAYIAAGTTLINDVKNNEFAIGRVKQTNKPKNIKIKNLTNNK